MTENLTQLRICVEKPLLEEHVMKHLSDKAILIIISKN